MKQRLFGMTVLFSVMFLLTVSAVFKTGGQTDMQEIRAGWVIGVNELVQLSKAGKWDAVSEKSKQLQDSIRMTEEFAGGRDSVFPIGAAAAVFFAAVFGYVYTSVLRPFEKMKVFAGEIARGNFEVPLNYERSNYFGAFTWAFDSMRREITRARACEHEAVENNKTVIATLSHDIKTPIASIRAYAEGLEANLDATAQKRQKYISVIMRKCDEVSALTNDLFLHSLADLNKLQIHPEKTDVCSFMEKAVAELMTEKQDVLFFRPSFTAYVMADKNRLLQLTENLINNARKYAKLEIQVFLTKEDRDIQIHFRDYGAGISDEDLPFVCDKFYRGRNCGSEQGSGLGLYIVKYIAGQMNGKLFLHSRPDGLEVTVCLPEADPSGFSS